MSSVNSMDQFHDYFNVSQSGTDASVIFVSINRSPKIHDGPTDIGRVSTRSALSRHLL